MKTTPIEPELTTSVQQFWKRILSSPEGQIGLHLLRQKKSFTPNTNDPEHAYVFFAGKCSGYDEMLYELTELANPNNVKE
jgi:hypothetical protein